MKKALILLLAVSASAWTLSAVVPGLVESKKVVIAFGTMFGVDGAFVPPEEGTDGGDARGTIRGVPGDELPWEISDSIRGRLETNGHLRIQVKGLVFADDPSVPEELRGKNDETEFRALVSCLTEDASGHIVVHNVITEGFPADELGFSDIDAHVELPNPCVAPIVFVMAGSENKWFAINGLETEDDD